MKLLYNTSTQLFQPYNRGDDEAVAQLDPVYQVYDVIQNEEPAYDPTTHYLQAQESTDHDARTVTRSWSVVAIPESEIKQRTLAEIVAQGYLVEPENITLGLSDGDRSLFTQMLALVKEALDLGLIDNDTVQTISDQSGTKHTLTTLRFRQIMVAYGMYYKGLWDQYSTN